MKNFNVAIVGATGLVGRTFIQILEQRNFPIANIRFLASERSVGKKLPFRGKQIAVEVLNEDSFKSMDLALFSAGAAVSLKFAPIAAECGTTVIDNSSAWRMKETVPLIVPEVNPHALKPEHRIIANPNCSTIQMVVAAKPLHDAARIKRIVVSTYQSVAGKGKAAVDALLRDSAAYLQDATKFSIKQHAFNAVPHIDIFMEDDSTKEETKMVQETRKIMGEPHLPVSATCVRVPIVNAHSCSVNLEFENPLEPEQARQILAKAPGVILMDDAKNEIYPTPLAASGKDEVFVGRIRRDVSVKYGLNLWVVADNLRKGAALNAIQIAELLI
jgi:aspartate-semialdehyde dehydrogenase